MGVYDFISHIVASLAWPLTVIFILRALINNGGKISGFVRSIKYKDIELILRDDFLAAKKMAIDIDSSYVEGECPSEMDDMGREVLEMAKIDPAMAIVKLWKELELRLIKVIQKNGLMRFTSSEKFIARLGVLGEIKPEEVELLERLRSIRNEAVHGYERGAGFLTIDEVIDYYYLSKSVMRRLDELVADNNYIDPA